MAAIILPHRWTTQPQYPVNPVSGIGLVTAVVPALWSGYTTTGTPSISFGQQGTLLKTASNNAARYKAALSKAQSPAASIIWVGEFYGTSTTDGCLCGITYANTNTTPYVGIELKRVKTGGGAGNVYLTWNNTTTFNYLGNAVAQDLTGQFIVIGSVTNGNQFFLLKNLTTGAETYLTSTVSGNIAYGSSPRFEVGDSLNATRHPNAGCAMCATFDYAISESFARELIKNPWQIFQPIQRRIWVPVSASGGATVSPSAGSVTYTGATPSISQPQTVAPSAGAVTWAGNTPTVSQAMAIAPTAGAVSITGNTPTISQPITVAPTAGAVALSGNVPEVSQAASIRPSAGAVVLSGNTPTISQPRTIAPSVGGYDILGNTPTVSQAALISPVSGQIVVLGNTPTISQPRTIIPSIGALVWAGGVPVIGVVEALGTIGAARTAGRQLQTGARSNIQTNRR